MKAKFKFSAANISFMHEHSNDMTGADMAAKFGCSKFAVGNYLRTHGLVPDQETKNRMKAASQIKHYEQKSRLKYKKEDRQIKRLYLKLTIKELSRKIKRNPCFTKRRMRAMNLVIPAEMIKQRLDSCRFKPGHVSANKGQKMSSAVREQIKHTFFKPGHRTNNKQVVGDITTRQMAKSNGGRKYQWIKVADPAVWRLYHVVVWEKENGQVPDGHCVKFIDGNSMNPEIKNLKLITKAENMALNTRWQWPMELQETIIIINKLKRKFNEHTEQSKEK